MFKNKIIISAPFGNYLQYTDTISTLGTFTVEKRDGKFGWYKWYKISTTLRYRYNLHSWQNKLGLPNPGIKSLRYKSLHNSIVSIYGFDSQDWQFMLECFKNAHLDTPLALELNISCPNLDEKLSVDPEVFTMAMETAIPIIVKLPPINYMDTFIKAQQRGIGIFHCCNTLPHANGGLSGAIVHPVSVDAVSRLHRYRQQSGDNFTIIGGGGIYNRATAMDFIHAGADSIAIGSALINPFTRKRRLHNIIYGDA